MGETTAVAHGGNPQDRAASPRPRCIASAVGLMFRNFHLESDVYKPTERGKTGLISDTF
ncbi:MAG: hypothetical protein F6J90_33340 [Moorea sp. SIOASIH]|uniref:hypothetical protein n=1 Tax=Moorena sp. SIOASIH TaxID=2607817 RepID=UPI0013B5B3C3|nr:hypothetical protein [Moorena sp. SIOASIH]NEO40953.1 hypothetical protein [Moorena sp. SIOASIH]